MFNNGGGNPNHDEKGRFTSGPNRSGSKSTEQKIKDMGFSGDDEVSIDGDYERSFGSAPDKDEFPEDYQKYMDNYNKWLNGETNNNIDASVIQDINDILDGTNPMSDTIDLGNGFLLVPYKEAVYGDDRDYNFNFDVMDEKGNYIDTMGVYGTEFDNDYQNKLKNIIKNYKIDDDYQQEGDKLDNDLEAAYKKYGDDEDAILDELRKNNYGMPNGDLQGVVESFVERKTYEYLENKIKDMGFYDGDEYEVEYEKQLISNGVDKNKLKEAKEKWKELNFLDPNSASWREIMEYYISEYNIDDVIKHLDHAAHDENFDEWLKTDDAKLRRI